MCAGLHLLSSSTVFERMCPLPDTSLSSNATVAFEAYHPYFRCAVKSNEWNPCGQSHALEMPLCVKEEVIVHNCSKTSSGHRSHKQERGTSHSGRLHCQEVNNRKNEEGLI